jgi:hypothetical protein
MIGKGHFDIIEEFNKLEQGSYVSLSCKGFGFIAIGKDDDSGECLLAIPVEIDSHAVSWEKYDKIINLKK